MQDQSIALDVVIVGAGPAGLAASQGGESPVYPNMQGGKS